MSAPVLTPEAARAHQSFSALLWSLSYPGRLRALPGPDAFLNVAEALLDLEVSAHTPDAALAARLPGLGVRAAAPQAADYLLYPEWTTAVLDELAEVKAGTPLTPDDSATLVLPARFGADGAGWRLSGPGVNGALDLRVSGVPAGFLPLRAAACRFPLGWDVFFVDGLQVLGLPRTTRIEVS